MGIDFDLSLNSLGSMVSFAHPDMYSPFGTTDPTTARLASSSSSSSSTAAPGQHQLQPQDPLDPDDGQFTTLFCRALYNYEAQDSSALSFRQDDIIEVLSQQPTGWWDGLLGEDRGWFPSNYVEIITDEEAEAAFAGSEMGPGTDFATTPGDTDNSMVNMSEALMRGSQSENEEWLDNEVAYRSGSRATTNGAANGTAGTSKAQPGDYWMPEITPDNQVSETTHASR